MGANDLSFAEYDAWFIVHYLIVLPINLMHRYLVFLQ